MEQTEDSSLVLLVTSRFWIQRILVPILVCIGAGGNIVSVIVLTRRRMRSSTNVYLTALAVADLMYLFFVLLLSFEHYPNIHDRKYEAYWRFYGITHWLCDAASSTSVWLTVSFTIERYIVVCHPMKGKVLCTENRAKSIISIVSILCLMATASTTFEYQLDLREDCIKQICDENDLRQLNITQNNQSANNITTIMNKFYAKNLSHCSHNHVNNSLGNANHSTDLHNHQNITDLIDQNSLGEILTNASDANSHLDFRENLEGYLSAANYTPDLNSINDSIDNSKITQETLNQIKQTSDNDVFYENDQILSNLCENYLLNDYDGNQTNPNVSSSGDYLISNSNCSDQNRSRDMNISSNEDELVSNGDQNSTCCVKSLTITTETTNLAKNKLYRTIIYWFSSISFGLLPLVLIAGFNCFLVNAVYKSQTQRKLMTNTKEKMSQSQENRITLLLIAIVVLFLLCQTPTASFLIYDAFDERKDAYTTNIKLALGNIFNFLLMLNAACNFILYCVLSDKYRRTFRTLFCHREFKRQDTLLGSTVLPQRIHSQRNGIKRGTTSLYTRNNRTPRDLESQSLTSIPRTKSLMQRSLGKAKTSDLHV